MAQYRAKPTAISNLGETDSTRRSARTPLPQCKQAGWPEGDTAFPSTKHGATAVGADAGHGLRPEVTRRAAGDGDQLRAAAELLPEDDASDSEHSPPPRHPVTAPVTNSRHAKRPAGTRGAGAPLEDVSATSRTVYLWRLERELVRPTSAGGEQAPLDDKSLLALGATNGTSRLLADQLNALGATPRQIRFVYSSGGLRTPFLLP